ncbi:unnamed protein product [Diamesa tonsa]
MWPSRGNSPSVEADCYYYKASPWSSSPLLQQDVSTAYASSFDLASMKNMVLENKNQMSWSSDDLSMDFSTPFNLSSLSYPTTSSQSNESHDLLSSPVNDQRASKFPEREFSDFITPDVERFFRELSYGSDIWKYDSDTTYTKDDFDFDFGSPPKLQPQAEIATEPPFRPSRSSTPVDSPENTFRPIDQLQFTQQTYQNNGGFITNHQKEEHGPWEVPVARRPLQHFNYQNRPVAIKYTKKVKPIVNYCVFCFNNGKEKAVYDSHTVRDSKGRCLCPNLRKYECPICHKDGDEAHTLKYCKEKKILTEEDMRRPVRRFL